MAILVNRAKMTTATTGTGTLTLGSAVSGYQSFADAGVTDADVVRYVIEDGTSWEIGEGTYTASGTTLSRTVLESSNADAAISLSGDAEVFVTAVQEDIVQPDVHSTLSAGFDSDAEALGTITSGTVTPEVDGTGEENFKTLSANGAFTLAPPSTSGDCVIIIRVFNSISAGTITTSGFDFVNGDTYLTTFQNYYFFHVKKIGGRNILTIEALQ